MGFSTGGWRRGGWSRCCGGTRPGQQPLNRRCGVVGAGVVEFDPSHRGAARRGKFAQRVGHQTSVGGIRCQCGETDKPTITGIADLADDLLSRQKSHQESVAARKFGQGRKCNDVEMSIAGERFDRLYLGRKQRPENQLRSVVDDRPRRLGGPFRSAGRVARN